MSKWRKGLIVSAVVIVAALIFWAGTNARPRVSVTVLRYETNHFPNQSYAPVGTSPLVSALVAVSNATGRDVAYRPATAGNINSREELVVYDVVRITNSWWKVPKLDHFPTGVT